MLSLRARRSLLIGLAGLAAFGGACALTACNSCRSNDGGAPPADAAPSVVNEPPVPAPANLLAEVVLVQPDAFWKRVQTGVGGEAMILQDTAGGIATSFAGLDPSVAREIDGASPFVAVIGDASPKVAFAIAMKLVDPARAASLLVDGETARYASKDVGGMRALVAKGGAPLPFAVAITRAGRLLLASNEADLAALGPYAARTMPSRIDAIAGKDAKAGLSLRAPRAGLSMMRAKLAAEWSEAKAWLLDQDAKARAKHGNRAADFADAPALVACVDGVIARRLALLGDLDAGTLTARAEVGSLVAAASLTPAAGAGDASQWVSAMTPGDAAPLLAAPADAVAALLVRDNSASREDDAGATLDCLSGALGARVTADDKKKLASAVNGWAKGRGDWEMLTALWSSTSRGAVVHAPAADVKAATGGLRDLVELFSRPLLADAIKRDLDVKSVSVATDVPAPGTAAGKATTATFARETGKRASASAAPLGLAWTAGDGSIDVAIGESPLALLGAARPAAKLGDDPKIVAALGALDGSVAFALVARPLVGDGAAVTFGWGKRGGDLAANLDLPYAVLRDLLKRSLMP